MTKETLRVGVIGCGAVAQIEWLPYLHELDEYKITALCDVSRELVDYFGELYGVENRCTDWRELLQCPDIDAVIVLNTDHAPVCVAAAQAGKDILVEKPLCENPRQAREIREAVEKAGVILMVGEMKRYDPGYQYAQKRIAQMKGLRMIRSRDICDGLMRSLNEIYPVRRRTDVSAECKRAFDQKHMDALREVTGELPPEEYSHFLAAGIHDIEILRGAFGDPKEVEYCELWNSGRMGLAVLAYESGVRASFEIGLTDQKWYEEELCAFGEDETIKVFFPHPYVKNQPTVVEITRNEGGAFVQERVSASFDEAFRAELRHFHCCAIKRETPITDVVQGQRDVELMARMFRTYAERKNQV